jgi:hypothetical protein
LPTCEPKIRRRGTTAQLRQIAEVFSRSNFAAVCRGDEDRASRALRSVVPAGLFKEDASRASALDALSNFLVREYRAEAVYKNAVANRLLFGRHSPRTTALLQEFRTGRSKVDCVVVNGRVHAYEIKTELDSPSRLAKQLDDYRRVFPRISVITDERLAERYSEILSETCVGVVALTRNGSHLSVRRSATDEFAHLRVESMMRSLTKPEYSSLVQTTVGLVPYVPSAKYFMACLDSVRDHDPKEVHRLFADQLRRRKLLAPEALEHDSMRSIRHLLAEINPSPLQASRLRHWLAEAVA